MDLPKWCALTFGGGSQAFRNAAYRLGKSAKRSEWFAEVRIEDDMTLAQHYPEFVRKHRSILVKRSRGYGYAIWKSYLLQETLRDLPSHIDGVVWIDSGCALNVNPTSSLRMREYFDLAHEHGTLSFHLKDWSDSQYTKSDTLHASGISPTLRDLPQIMTTLVFLSKNRQTAQLVREWHEWACADNYHHSDDSPSVSPELPEFIAHRHDQSIWSLIVKRENAFSIEDETYFAPKWRSEGASFPIWAVRQRSGTPPLSTGLFWEAVRRIEARRD